MESGTAKVSNSNETSFKLPSITTAAESATNLENEATEIDLEGFNFAPNTENGDFGDTTTVKVTLKTPDPSKQAEIEETPSPCRRDLRNLSGFEIVFEEGYDSDGHLGI